MTKIVKFKVESTEEDSSVQKAGKVIKAEMENDIAEDEEMAIKKAVEEHILSNFAVKNILGMDIVYKVNKTNLGVIGRVVYQHKRREGTFIADFIAKGGKRKDSFFIDTLAFEAGEPQLYNEIFKILKAKKALPNL